MIEGFVRPPVARHKVIVGTGGSRAAVDSRGKVRRLRLSGEDRQASHSEDDCQSTGMQAEEFLTISNP